MAIDWRQLLLSNWRDGEVNTDVRIERRTMVLMHMNCIFDRTHLLAVVSLRVETIISVLRFLPDNAAHLTLFTLLHTTSIVINTCTAFEHIGHPSGSHVKNEPHPPIISGPRVIIALD